MSALRAAAQALRQQQPEEHAIPTAWPEDVDMPQVAEGIDMGIPTSEPEPEPAQEFKPNQRWQKDQVKGVAIADSVPMSIEAEKGVLSSLMQAALFGNDTARKTMFIAEQQLGDGHFFQHAHKEIWRALKNLHANNDPLDFITVTNELQDAGQLVSVGGHELVAELSGFVPTHANLDYYIGILRDKNTQRQILNLANEVKSEILAAGTDVQLVIQSAKERIEKISTASGVLDSGIEVTSFKELASFDTDDDKDSVLGYRWLCRGGASLWIGQSGIGKSSLAMQAGMMWAQAKPFFGVRPTRGKRLKSLFIQAENDAGDMAEMMQGVLKAFPIPEGVSREDFIHEMNSYMIFARDTIHTGADFARSAAKLIEKSKPDLVWVDPLLSYAGDDISSQKVASNFLRNTLNPIAFDYGIIWNLLHHTGKPSTDPKAKAHWNDHDFSYAAFGSSELVNWARAVNVLRSLGGGNFELRFSKRGKRAGLTEYDPFPPGTTDHQPAFTDCIYLKHAEKAIFWEQTQAPEGESKPASGREKSGKYKKDPNNTSECVLELLKEGKIPRKPTELLALCQEQLGMKERTFWDLWKELRESKQVLMNKDRRWSPLFP